MSPEFRDPTSGETPLTVRYWASIRAAAGCAEEQLSVPAGTTLAGLAALLRERHGEEFARVSAVCSVLVDDRPVGSRSPESVLLEPGVSVEFLPPFAGG